MQRTLLQVVQSYLDRTNGFYVDSIYDTDESQQVASIAEDIFYSMVQEYSNLLFIMKDMALDSVSDTTRPNMLLIPKDIQKIQRSKLYYNVAEGDGETLNYKEIQYVPPMEYLARTSLYSDKSPDTQIVEGFDENKMVVKNNQWPSFCTSFDGKYIVFDSFNQAYDTTLQASKSRVVATEEPVFYMEDDFIIPVPNHLSESYLNMFLAECYNLLYQQANPILEQRARRARVKLQQDNRVMGGSEAKKSYGRKGSIASYVPKGHRSN